MRCLKLLSSASRSRSSIACSSLGRKVRKPRRRPPPHRLHSSWPEHRGSGDHMGPLASAWPCIGDRTRVARDARMPRRFHFLSEPPRSDGLHADDHRWLTHSDFLGRPRRTHSKAANDAAWSTAHVHGGCRRQLVCTREKQSRPKPLLAPFLEGVESSSHRVEPRLELVGVAASATFTVLDRLKARLHKNDIQHAASGNAPSMNFTLRRRPSVCRRGAGRARCGPFEACWLFSSRIASKLARRACPGNQLVRSDTSEGGSPRQTGEAGAIAAKV